jgi:hypothetical protein
VRATEELLNNNTSALPQIRVRSESNVEFCTQLPSANKMQRTSSFSGGAAAMAVAAAVVNKWEQKNEKSIIQFIVIFI